MLYNKLEIMSDCLRQSDTIKAIHCAPLAGRHWVPAQISSVSTQSQLVSTNLHRKPQQMAAKEVAVALLWPSAAGTRRVLIRCPV